MNKTKVPKMLFLNPSHHRTGYSVIELLTVIALTSILASLVLISVQASRESARKIECQSRLKQLGISLEQFISTYRGIPGGLSWRIGRKTSGGYGYSTQSALLLGLEQHSVDSKIDWTGVAPVWDPVYSILHKINYHPTLEITIPAFLCPSDHASHPHRRGTNYRFCMGDAPYYSEGGTDPQYWGRGPFSFLGIGATQGIRDGMSNTVAVSERTLGSGNESLLDERRDVWYSGIANNPEAVLKLTADELLYGCGQYSGSGDHYPFSGSTWLMAGYEFTTYNHVGPPNPLIPDCSARSSLGQREFPSMQFAMISARSWHSGGVNSLFLDGRVQFVKDHIDLKIWRAWATRAGGELFE